MTDTIIDNQRLELLNSKNKEAQLLEQKHAYLSKEKDGVDDKATHYSRRSQTIRQQMEDTRTRFKEVNEERQQLRILIGDEEQSNSRQQDKLTLQQLNNTSTMQPRLKEEIHLDSDEFGRQTAQHCGSPIRNIFGSPDVVESDVPDLPPKQRRLTRPLILRKNTQAQQQGN